MARTELTPLTLLVPSALVPATHNALINPLHAQAANVQVIADTSFVSIAGSSLPHGAADNSL